jgi:hypothetical protein
MRTGRSIYWHDAKVYEAEFSEAILTDTRFIVHVPDFSYSGDIIILELISADNGSTFNGSYSYRRKTYNPGTIRLNRVRNQNASDTLKGRWEEGGSTGTWIFEIDAPL